LRRRRVYAHIAGLAVAELPAASTPSGGGGDMHTGSSVGDAITAARFSLTIDGVEIAQFSELVGITSDAEPDNLAGFVLKKLPGKRHPPTVTLRRGLTTDMQISTWHDTAVEGRTSEARKNAALVMYDTAGDPVARYHLENAWPSKLEVSSLKAGASDLFETLTLTCDSTQRVAP
jgi:phage tail-like protein